MIILETTTDSLKIVLQNAITTNEMQCVANYRLLNTTTFTPKRSVANTNSTTPVNIIGSPTGSDGYACDFFTVYNKDTVGNTLTISLDISGTPYVIWRGVLNAGELLQYQDGVGFDVKAFNGATKVQQSFGSGPMSGLQSVVLLSDVVNNNATANTMQNVTGLEIPVVAGSSYWFRYIIKYGAAAGTTGSRWSVSGPSSPTNLVYKSNYTLTAASETIGINVSYDLPVASNASSVVGANGNIAFIEGFITPSSSGTIVPNFASEVASSAITAKAGSIGFFSQVL